MMESMNSFQTFTRNEIDYLKSKLSTLESNIDDVMRTGKQLLIFIEIRRQHLNLWYGKYD